MTTQGYNLVKLGGNEIAKNMYLMQDPEIKNLFLPLISLMKKMPMTIILSSSCIAFFPMYGSSLVYKITSLKDSQLVPVETLSIIYLLQEP